MGNSCFGNEKIPEKPTNLIIPQTNVINPFELKPNYCSPINNREKYIRKYLLPTIEHNISGSNEKNEIFINLKLPDYTENNYKEFIEIINGSIYNRKVITVTHINPNEVILSLEI